MRRALVFCFVVILAACEKEKTGRDLCEELKTAVVNDNSSQAQAALAALIHTLPTQEYSQANLNNLAGIISENCGGTATVLCFDCILTLPAQSEIRVSYPLAGGTYKIFDLSYNSQNEIEVIGTHL